MDNNTKYFISLLSAFINGQKPVCERGIDWEQVYKLARIHSVSGMVYLVAKELEEEYKPVPELLGQMKKDFIGTTMRATSQENEMDTIIKALNEAEIPHVLMKGYVLRNYYPAREMRTMGDIDFLIRSEDREKAHKLIQSLGYKPGHVSGEVWDYTKGIVHLEIHTQIMYHNMHNGTDYVKYFSDAWKHAVQTSAPYTFEFDTEYHFLFLMVHMAKHFDGSGCGIRMIMDIAVCLNYFRDKLHWGHIDEELEKLNLKMFSKNIYILCSKWFDTSFNFQLPAMEKRFYEELSKYIISAGTFGVHGRNQKARTLRNEYVESKVGNNGLAKKMAMINVYRKLLFPDYQAMSTTEYYSFIKNKPVLLPVGWIYRFIRSTLVKFQESFAILKNIAKGREDSRKQYEVISELGL